MIWLQRDNPRRLPPARPLEPCRSFPFVPSLSCGAHRGLLFIDENSEGRCSRSSKPIEFTGKPVLEGPQVGCTSQHLNPFHRLRRFHQKAA